MKHITVLAMILTVIFTFSLVPLAQSATKAGQQDTMHPEMIVQMTEQVSAAQLTLPQQALWVANGLDDTLSVIDVTTGAVAATITSGINPHILNASPDGRFVYVINAGAHDREPGAHADDAEAQPEQPEHHDQPKPNQQTDTTSDVPADTGNASGNSLWVFDTGTGRVIAKIPVGQGPTHPVTSPDGRWVYVTNTDADSVSVIDTSTWQVAATITDLPEPHDGEVTPDGRLLYLATSENSTVTVVDTATHETSQTFTVGKKPRGVVAGGIDGQIAYVTNKGDGTLSLLDVPSSQITATVPVGDGAHALRVSPDKTTVYVTLSKEDSVAVVDAVSGEVLKKIAVGQTPEQIDLSLDGRWLAAANNAEGTVSLIDTQQGVVTATIPVGRGAYGLQFVNTPVPSVVSNAIQQPSGYFQITAEQLHDALADKRFTLVNVHIPYAGDIPQTDLQIPFNQIVDNLEKLPGKDQPVVIYCRSGSMSAAASRELVGLGYTNIIEVNGGFNAWQQAGYELEFQTN